MSFDLYHFCYIQHFCVIECSHFVCLKNICTYKGVGFHNDNEVYNMNIFASNMIYLAFQGLDVNVQLLPAASLLTKGSPQRGSKPDKPPNGFTVKPGSFTYHINV